MNEPSNPTKTWRGGCHCGRIAFEVTGAITDITECNCSICTKKGYVHWIVPRESFRMLTPAENLATYRFNTGVAQHHFCPTCGIASFYVPRSNPDQIDINVRCLDDVDLSEVSLRKFDGRNWEAAIDDFHKDRGERK